MKAQLFLFYLRFLKPIILISAVLAITIISLDNWQRYKYRTADYTPWTLVSVNSGSSFNVTCNNETKTIDLCGVEASGDKAKNFLQSVINLGDRIVIIRHYHYIKLSFI